MNQHLFPSNYEAWTNCLTESLAERLFKCLQPLLDTMCRVYSAILMRQGS